MTSSIAGVFTSTISARSVKEFIERSIETDDPVELSVIHQQSGNAVVISVTFKSAFAVTSLDVLKDMAHGLNHEGKEVVVLLGSAEEEDTKMPTILVSA